MRGMYVWKDGGPVAEPSLREWCIFMECKERRVRVAEIGEITVSTVFLALDHSFGSPVPLLFETMVFGDGLPALNQGFWSDSMWRYETLEQAVRGHRIVIEKAREFLPAVKVVDRIFPIGEWLPGGEAKAQDILLSWRDEKS